MKCELKYMNKEKVVLITEKLIKAYPEAKPSLDFENPYQMLVAVCLSAQCTDERVNKVTPALFKKFKTPEDMAKAKVSEIEKYISSVSFYHNKTKHLKEACKRIVEVYEGEVPNKMEELVTLSGVGRKSANVIMLDAFNIAEGIAVDTHVGRISRRIGFSNNKDPEKVEKDLLKKIPNKYWKDVNHVFIYHGRKTCKAINPMCDMCPINDICMKKGVKK